MSWKTGPDLYISQSDYSVLRETVAYKDTQSALSIKVRENLSQYGKAVHVTLPKACAGKLVARAIVTGHGRISVRLPGAFAIN